jgi:curli production assembly/transport component CsgG
VGQTNCVSFLTCIEEARIIRPSLEKLRSLRPPKQKAVVAVYKFSDLTGQRKSSSKMALFSTAVTQGAENYLIEALRGAGNGNWFTVVERSGLDHLTRERQLIKSTRQTYEGEGSNILKPLLYAGLIVEGGIISYDSNLRTGGSGARYLGIGASNEYREDEITVSLRVILVQTGEVLLNVTVSKSILSARTSNDFFRFIEEGTELVEIETGYSENEAIGYATRTAIETAVYQLVIDGLDKQLWDYNYEENT